MNPDFSVAPLIITGLERRDTGLIPPIRVLRAIAGSRGTDNSLKRCKEIVDSLSKFQGRLVIEVSTNYERTILQNALSNVGFIFNTSQPIFHI